MAKAPKRERKPKEPAAAGASCPAPAVPEEGVHPSVDGGLCPVVGIGASAGGLEAVRELLGSLSDRTGMAIVVVLHLAPSHESMVSQILGRSTSMPVQEARQGMRVEPDHVYVIPPNRNMAIVHGGLRLAMRTGGRDRFLPVDSFFHSLAEECGNKAIGIVLSGASSDGVQGLRAIKISGGITFAQDEESAKYPEMPRNAVASGAVDLVLRPSEIARELGRLRNHSYVLARPAASEEPDSVSRAEAPQLEQVLQLLRVAQGTDFTYYKQSTIRRRILRRMALSRIERIPDYVDYLKENPKEVAALYDDVLINVTSFFRDPTAFRALTKRVIPALLRKRDKDDGVRIWVPGCSSGEEVYSLAICLFEHLGDRRDQTGVQIFGTDVSDLVIERARAGRYPASITADVSPERLRRYFVRHGDGYQVSKALRDVCVFAKHNLLKDPPFSKIDLVSCRNVMIYFGSILQKKAISIFHYALRPNGYLVLGSSENISGFNELFTLLDKKQKIYVKKGVPSRLTFGAGGVAAELGGIVATLGPSQPKGAEARAVDIQKEADRIVMSRYVPAGVVVDDDMNILQFRGHTGPFLEPRAGMASLDLLKMAREGLVLEIRTAFQRAKKEGGSVKREGIRLKTNGHVAEVDVEVVPFSMRHTRGRLYLVLFNARLPVRPGRRGAPVVPPPKKGKPGRRSSTEAELAATKEYLQTIIEEQEATNEELMSANEEILSSNEELQSTNEELETAKEELQSSNEELSTVNDELQTRVSELHDLNNDLTNLIGTIHIPMLILDSDLRIRRASPMAERLLNLVPADAGRRVTDLRPNVEMPRLDEIVHEVVETVLPKDLEVRDDQGRWYSMRIRPYKTRENKIDGVVITWVDIDGAKRSARENARHVARSFVDGEDRPAALLDTELRLDFANPAWNDAFRGGHARGPAAWGDVHVIEALKGVLAGGAPCAVRVPAAVSKALDLHVRGVSEDGAGSAGVLVVARPHAGA
jgi:two-component system CheB/CheR fusion protein